MSNASRTSALSAAEANLHFPEVGSEWGSHRKRILQSSVYAGEGSPVSHARSTFSSARVLRTAKQASARILKACLSRSIRRFQADFYPVAALWPTMRKSSYVPALNSALCILIIFLCLSLFLTRGLGLYAARATGESMLPAIPKDALIVLSSRHPEIGDIVHVKNEKYNYAHRLVAIEGEKIVTKGDNCDSSEVARLADVRGVVVFHSSFTSFLFLAFAVIGIEGVLGAFWAGRLLKEVRQRSLETSSLLR